jgi:3,4-dihydroxy 2-butanone 4-phosphate synthase/GTP cyclohydrolase II
VYEALAAIDRAGRGVIVLLNCSQSAPQLIEHVAEIRRDPPVRRELLSYGIGAQILRDLKVGKMRLMAAPRKMPSMAGWELEIAGYESPARAALK